jgi:hypothetical protein
MNLRSTPISLAALFLLGGCVSLPTGPSMMVLPGTGKNFDQFRFDDGSCRQFAFDQTGGATPGAVAEDAGARSALLGAAIGAVAGAAIGGGHGAAVGAGTGLAVGGLTGTAAANQSAYGAQGRYDVAYQQCMYAKGHRVPVSGRFAQSYATPAPAAMTPPPPPSGTPYAASPPPPPPGAPPPPPPGYR